MQRCCYCCCRRSSYKEAYCVCCYVALTRTCCPSLLQSDNGNALAYYLRSLLQKQGHRQSLIDMLLLYLFFVVTFLTAAVLLLLFVRLNWILKSIYCLWLGVCVLIIICSVSILAYFFFVAQHAVFSYSFFWFIAFYYMYIFFLVFGRLLFWTLERAGWDLGICCHRASGDEVFVQGGRLMEPLPGLMQSADTLTKTQTVLVVAPVHLHTTLYTHPRMNGLNSRQEFRPASGQSMSTHFCYAISPTMYKSYSKSVDTALKIEKIFHSYVCTMRGMKRTNAV